MHPPLPLNQPAKGRPNPLNPYIEGVSNGASRAFFINMTTGVPAAIVISSGAACRYGR